MNLCALAVPGTICELPAAEHRAWEREIVVFGMLSQRRSSSEHQRASSALRSEAAFRAYRPSQGDRFRRTVAQASPPGIDRSRF